MNSKNKSLCKFLIFVILVLLNLGAKAETNALGQQITFINPVEVIKSEKIDKQSNIWSRINSGYGMKERPSRRIRNYEKWYSKKTRICSKNA